MSEDKTREVVQRHLECWQRGDVEGLMADYADDAVMLNKDVGALVGKEVIGGMFTQVFATVFRPEDTTLRLGAAVYSGENALVHWEAETSALRATSGFDSFVVKDGLIVVQAGGADMAPKS